METTFWCMFIVLLKLHGHLHFICKVRDICAFLHSFSEFSLSSFFASHLIVKGILCFL